MFMRPLHPFSEQGSCIVCGEQHERQVDSMPEAGEVVFMLDCVNAVARRQRLFESQLLERMAAVRAEPATKGRTRKHAKVAD